jgi:hypothetical protein
MTAINISRAGLTGTLRLMWVTDTFAHLAEHAGHRRAHRNLDRPGLPGHHWPVGTDVDLDVLRHLAGQGEIADLASLRQQAFQAAMHPSTTPIRQAFTGLLAAPGQKSAYGSGSPPRPHNYAWVTNAEARNAIGVSPQEMTRPALQLGAGSIRTR